MDQQLTVSFHGAATTLALSEILYIESVDRKCFVYTKDNVFETTKRLYELEQQLVFFVPAYQQVLYRKPEKYRCDPGLP